MTMATDEERLGRLEERQEATNQRLDDMRSDFNARLEDMRSDFNTRFEDMRSDFNTRFEDMRSDFNTRFDDGHARITETNTRLDKLMFVLYGLGAATIATLVANLITLATRS
jgi:DNA anti-recombination protein RmuC